VIDGLPGELPLDELTEAPVSLFFSHLAQSIAGRDLFGCRREQIDRVQHSVDCLNPLFVRQPPIGFNLLTKSLNF
jgi:hypothetical protein